MLSTLLGRADLNWLDCQRGQAHTGFLSTSRAGRHKGTASQRARHASQLGRQSWKPPACCGLIPSAKPSACPSAPGEAFAHTRTLPFSTNMVVDLALAWHLAHKHGCTTSAPCARTLETRNLTLQPTTFKIDLGPSAAFKQTVNPTYISPPLQISIFHIAAAPSSPNPETRGTNILRRKLRGRGCC